MTATGDAQQSSQASTIPPGAQLFEMMSGFWLAWMLYVVAERGVADLLADGPQTSVELAQAAGLHEPSLYRILRTLSSFGVFDGGVAASLRAERRSARRSRPVIQAPGGN